MAPYILLSWDTQGTALIILHWDVWGFFVLIFNTNEYNCIYDPITALMKTVVPEVAHVFGERRHKFRSKLPTIHTVVLCLSFSCNDGSCVFRRLQKCSPENWDSEWSFYAFDIQSKSAWTHQRLLMTGAGLILEWSKHSKSVTFARKLMVPP